MESRFNVFISRYYSIKKISRGSDSSLCALGDNGDSLVWVIHTDRYAPFMREVWGTGHPIKGLKNRYIMFGFKHFTEIHRKS